MASFADIQFKNNEPEQVRAQKLRMLVDQVQLFAAKKPPATEASSVAWDNITGKPTVFPPDPDTLWPFKNITGEIDPSQVPEDAVTQYQSDLEIDVTQIVGLVPFTPAAAVAAVAAASESTATIQFADIGGVLTWSYIPGSIPIQELATSTPDVLFGTDDSGDPTEIIMGTGVTLSGGVLSTGNVAASAVSFDDTGTLYSATNVQDALDFLDYGENDQYETAGFDQRARIAAGGMFADSATVQWLVDTGDGLVQANVIGGGVSQLIAGSNVTLTPTDGLGVVTVSATGSTGAQGPIGPPGLTGDQGDDGELGPPGPSGTAGPTGGQGPIGPPGPQGDDGDDGGIGPPGASGVAGSIGIQGPSGAPGLQGDPGEDGDRGPPGANGAAGAAGATGATGANGAAGATGATGAQGPVGMDGQDGNDADNIIQIFQTIPVVGRVKIAEQVLGSATATVAFSAIPQTYRNLILEMTTAATSAGNENIAINLNGDGAANYVWGIQYNGGSQSNLGQSSLYGSTTPSQASAITGTELIFHNYAGTVFWKSMVGVSSRFDSGNIYIVSIAGSWESTAAITSMVISIPASTFPAGCVFTLYCDP